jgi:hypothetical protein
MRGSLTPDLTIPYSSASIGVAAAVFIKPAQQAVAGKT